MVDLQINCDSLKKMEKLIVREPKQMQYAFVRAVNRAIPTVTKAVKKDVTAEYTIKSTDVARNMKTKKCSSSNLSAGVIIKGTPLKLSRFKFKPTTIPHTRKQQLKGVQLRVKKTGGYIKSSSKPPLFVGSGSGGTEVYRRENGMYKIGWGFTLSVPQMVSSDKVYDQIQKAASIRVSELLEHEIDYRLSKLAGEIK